MKQLYCKNCGAPIEHKYTHRCRYCDTVIFSDDIEDELEDNTEYIEDRIEQFDNMIEDMPTYHSEVSGDVLKIVLWMGIMISSPYIIDILLKIFIGE
jgi:hypothetical protein